MGFGPLALAFVAGSIFGGALTIALLITFLDATANPGRYSTWGGDDL